MTLFGPDIEATGTDPFEDELISIQYRDSESDENHLFPRWDYGSEADLLFDFFMKYGDIRWSRRGGAPLRVGYRVTDFDVPFILVRSFETGVIEKLRAGPGFVWKNIVWGPSYLDLAHLLGADMASFEQWRKKLTETESPSTGSEIPELYSEGEYDRIVEYVTDELSAMEDVFRAVRETDHFEYLMESRKSIGLERELL